MVSAVTVRGYPRELVVQLAANKTNLVEILDSLVSAIKQHIVHSFLVTFTAAIIPFGLHVTWVILCCSWPKPNYTLTRQDVMVAWKYVEYNCRCVNLVQSDGVSTVIIDEYGCGSGTCDESAIVQPVRPASKYSGTH